LYAYSNNLKESERKIGIGQYLSVYLQIRDTGLHIKFWNYGLGLSL